MADSLMRFLFDQAPVRGEVVSLDRTWQEVLQRHDYPPLLQALLGELMAAAAYTPYRGTNSPSPTNTRIKPPKSPRKMRWIFPLLM